MERRVCSVCKVQVTTTRHDGGTGPVICAACVANPPPGGIDIGKLLNDYAPPMPAFDAGLRVAPAPPMAGGFFFPPTSDSLQLALDAANALDELGMLDTMIAATKARLLVLADTAAALHRRSTDASDGDGPLADDLREAAALL